MLHFLNNSAPKPNKCIILRLHVNLTQDINLLLELPEEYTFETALADLIVRLLLIEQVQSLLFHILALILVFHQDNSLQAVLSNGKYQRKLITHDYMRST
ncbi:hypothetical protein VNO77_03746 [Canavalia gladiata]|uniref:Uncharacterized protein n=1 Tax=Canavalia gladiata TaxID=3824 RepID=A0AAN9N0F1_CANGL